jgi:soluble lytic murein transglycosylase-like protein
MEKLRYLHPVKKRDSTGAYEPCIKTINTDPDGTVLLRPTIIQVAIIKLRSASILVAVLFISAAPPSAQADIYMFIDSQGVLHFTNAPTSSQYTLYIKERPKPAEVTKKYDGIIQEASNAYGLSFSLLKAMIRVESNFNSRAVSKKGALGLMQIMPQNLQALNIRDPYDPKENIMGGARYLKSMMERFEGKLPLALAAYNAGPTIVDKYENIPPIKETKDYVKKVMKYFYLYQKS